MYVCHNFSLRATRCPKGTVDTSNCPVRKNKVGRIDTASPSQKRTYQRLNILIELPVVTGLWYVCVFMQPEIDCAICFKTIAGKMQASPTPYLLCIRKPALTEVRSHVHLQPSTHCTGNPGSNSTGSHNVESHGFT